MWPADHDTQDLLNDAREGDGDAVQRLMERHRAAIHRLVQMRLDRKIQRRVDVSDIVQEVLVEANRRMQDYLASGNGMPFHLWLRQITRDRIIDAHRRHRGSEKRSVDRERALAAPAGSSRAARTTRRVSVSTCSRSMMISRSASRSATSDAVSVIG